jgi:anaerobic ribonucleoside-triphosphate reductase activating protein
LLTSDAGYEVTTERLVERLCRIEGDIEGITLSGGDPADQPEAVVELLRGLRARRPSWNVLLYTGYTLAQMRQDPVGQGALLPLVDLLIDGPFLREVAPVHPLAGSGNQELHALTAAGEAMLRAVGAGSPPGFNLAFFREGGTRLIGVSSPAERDRVHRVLQLTSPDDDQIR